MALKRHLDSCLSKQKSKPSKSMSSASQLCGKPRTFHYFVVFDDVDDLDRAKEAVNLVYRFHTIFPDAAITTSKGVLKVSILRKLAGMDC